MKAALPIVASASVLLSSGARGLADSNIPPAALSGSTNVSVGAVPGQALTPEEAEQALKRLNRKIRGPGTWRSTTLMFAPDPPDTNVIPGWLASSNVTYGWPTSTNVTFAWRLPDGRRFMREEITERDQSGDSQSRLYVRNEQGYWALLKSVAILHPEVTNASVELGVVGKSYDVVTGGRIKEGDRVRLHIIQSFSEAGYRELVKEVKKEVPLLLRPLFKASFIEKVLEQVAPSRVETVMDEQTGDLIVERQYRKDGKPLDEEQGWSPVDDLPAEAYAVPEGLKQVRPKTVREARRLEEKARAEEKKSAKKR
jgi:hypothetical protein